MIIRLLLSILLTACAQKEQAYNFEVDNSLLPYYNMFMDDAVKREIKILPNVVIKFEKLKWPRIGQCNWYAETPIVSIDPDYWNKTSECRKKLIMYHELGHCMLFLDHDDNYSTIYNMPQSIMNSYIFSGSWFCYWEKDYVDQLFGLKKKTFEE